MLGGVLEAEGWQRKRLGELYLTLSEEKMTCIDWLGREIELEKMCRVIKESL